MTRYIIRRVLWMIPVLLFVSIITFTLMHITPGGPWDKDKAVAPQVIANLNAKYNLDKPAWQQYLIYMSGAIRGDLGPSYTYQDRSVTQIILGGLPATASLGFFCRDGRVDGWRSTRHFRGDAPEHRARLLRARLRHGVRQRTDVRAWLCLDYCFCVDLAPGAD